MAIQDVLSHSQKLTTTVVADETKESSLRSMQASASLAELVERLETMVGQFRV